MSQAATMSLALGDVVVSKSGNRWRCEAWIATDLPGDAIYVLRNRPSEVPNARGTVYRGPWPDWAASVERDGNRVWTRPTPVCECPSFAAAKGPYPSGFCPECGKWYPGIDRARALELGHLKPAAEETTDGQ